MKTRILRKLCCALLLATATEGFAREPVTPNDFEGSDTRRIRLAVEAAKGTTNSVTIPRRNANGTNVWMIDSAILLPSGMTVILDDCTLQLSDSCRDNLFRSDNVGIGITDPAWNENIAIVGVGNAVLKGAANPRATGDGLRNLSLDPGPNHNRDRSSYGTDAGRIGRKQKSDWRNFMILMAYVKGFELKNVRIEYAHTWAVNFERVHHAEISNIRLYTPQYRYVGGEKKYTFNNDGIDLREGCKYFRIDDITSVNGDDCIALSALDMGPEYHTNGNIDSFQVTSCRHNGPEDDIEHIYITNIKTNYTGVALRASDSASIHHVYIDGVITAADPTVTPPYAGSPYVILVGNRAYGKPAERHTIHDIYVMNVIGDGLRLIDIKSPIADCVFMNAVYTGNKAPAAITYRDGIREQCVNVQEINLVKAPGSGRNPSMRTEK